MNKEKFVRYEVDDNIGIIKWESYRKNAEVEVGETIIPRETFIEAYRKWIAEPREWERKLP